MNALIRVGLRNGYFPFTHSATFPLHGGAVAGCFFSVGNFNFWVFVFAPGTPFLPGSQIVNSIKNLAPVRINCGGANKPVFRRNKNADNND